MGPPEKGRGPTARSGPATTDAYRPPRQLPARSHSTASRGRGDGDPLADLAAELDRRWDAAARSEPLPCGQHRDPLVCLARRRVVPSARMVDAGADAAAHLLELGLTPVLELEVLRALWRRRGPDRALADDLRRRGGIAA